MNTCRVRNSRRESTRRPNPAAYSLALFAHRHLSTRRLLRSHRRRRRPKPLLIVLAVDRRAIHHGEYSDVLHEVHILISPDLSLLQKPKAGKCSRSSTGG